MPSGLTHSDCPLQGSTDYAAYQQDCIGCLVLQSDTNMTVLVKACSERTNGALFRVPSGQAPISCWSLSIVHGSFRTNCASRALCRHNGSILSMACPKHAQAVSQETRPHCISRKLASNAATSSAAGKHGRSARGCSGAIQHSHCGLTLILTNCAVACSTSS